VNDYWIRRWRRSAMGLFYHSSRPKLTRILQGFAACGGAGAWLTMQLQWTD